METTKLFKDLDIQHRICVKANVAKALGLVHDINTYSNVSGDRYKVEVKLNDWTYSSEFQKMTWYACSDMDNFDKQDCMSEDDILQALDDMLEAWRAENNKKVELFDYIVPCQE